MKSVCIFSSLDFGSKYQNSSKNPVSNISPLNNILYCNTAIKTAYRLSLYPIWSSVCINPILLHSGALCAKFHVLHQSAPYLEIYLVETFDKNQWIENIPLPIIYEFQF